MSVLTSLSNAVIKTFDAVAEVGEAAESGIGMCTKYVHNRARKQKLTDLESVKISTAKEMVKHKRELDADKELKAMYDELDAEWGK